MNTFAPLERDGHRLLQFGIVLLLFSSLYGFAIPSLASPRIALSVHTLSALEAVMMLAIGLLWPKLRLTRRPSGIALWSLIYSAVAILAAYTVASISGAGIETIRLMGELPEGLSRGTPLVETAIKVLSYSSAPTVLLPLVLILWGLRLPAEDGSAK